MVSSDARERMLRRAATELRDGMTVNIGIGLPTGVIPYMAPGVQVCVHSENGITGMGAPAEDARRDRNLIDAGGGYVTTVPGAAFFDSAVSFGMVRRGLLDLSILGAFEIAQNGDLANWMIPGRLTPGVGGAVELAQKARRLLIVTTHRDKTGRPKLLGACTLPLTAPACVDRIVSDLAVIDVGAHGFILRELASGVEIDDVVAATGAPLEIPDTPLPRF